MANVQVGTRMPLAQAMMVQQILAAEGIEAELVHGHLPGQECRLFVNEADAPMAEVFLAASDAETEAETLCPSCGEANPGTFAQCWSCGAALDGEPTPDAEPPPAPREPESPTPSVTAPARATVPAAWLGLAVVLLLLTNLFWLFQHTGVTPTPDNPLLSGYRDDGRCILEYWKNGELSAEWCDAGDDGVYESYATYNRDGQLIDRYFDADENGLAEAMNLYDRTRRLAEVATDIDGDGWFDSYTELLATGHEVAWHDRDGDTVFEERRVMNADGEVLFIERDTPEGFRRQRQYR